MAVTWTLLGAVIALATQLCTGENSCSVSSTSGPDVELGSSFKIYFTFKCQCKFDKSMCHPPTLQDLEVLNSTTVFFNVVNVSRDQTYSCQCDCPNAPDSCGMDVSTGYAPAVPTNISCIYKVQTNESGTVLCSWDRGRDTYLTTSSSLWVRTPSGEQASGAGTYSVSPRGYGVLWSSLDLSSSVHHISVWVESKNPLGSVESVSVNYTLSDIVSPSPPDLGPPSCSSRECVVLVNQSLRTESLEIQYRSEAGAWTPFPDPGAQAALTLTRSVSSLRPYSLYHFRARARFSTGMWSRWSSDVFSWTQEEAPAKEPDVWQVEVGHESLRVYWKEGDLSDARGRIRRYRVSVYDQDSGLLSVANVSADSRNHVVRFGAAAAAVTVCSCTSKGCSPPARISPRYAEAQLLQVAHEAAGETGGAISWRNDGTAAGYVVEWYPQGHKLEELRWMRLGRNDTRALITGLEPFECYAGAVYAVHGNGSMSRTGFTGVATSESVPGAVPSILEEVDGADVEVSWTQIPRAQRGGCITTYSIYLESSSGERQVFSVPASEETYAIKDLSPDAYTLWMTASTSVGEGPTGQRSKVKFFIAQTPFPTLQVVGLIAIMVLILLVCLCQRSTVKQRVLGFLLPKKVPDPANSRWAKECVPQKGKLKLQLQVSVSSVPPEEDPILAEVEEVPRRSPPPTRLSPASKRDLLVYPPTAYIKSFSHDSDGSKQTSLDTNTTVDYISAHVPDQEDEEEEEEEEDFPEMMGFFPSHDFGIGPLDFGGKLTLDAVRINCGEFFLDNF